MEFGWIGPTPGGQTRADYAESPRSLFQCAGLLFGQPILFVLQHGQVARRGPVPNRQCIFRDHFSPATFSVLRPWMFDSHDPFVCIYWLSVGPVGWL